MVLKKETSAFGTLSVKVSNCIAVETDPFIVFVVD